MTDTILGAIVGDTVGSVYEFNPTKNYDFRLFDDDSIYTDDTIITIAVAQWLLDDPGHTPQRLVEIMQDWGRRYPNPYGAYGGMFSHWLVTENPQPYKSWGNGSAMRVSPVGFFFDTLDETLRVAEISASVTHNHPEGIKGAQATAAAIFLARNGKSKDEIRDYITSALGYDLSRSYGDIKDGYHFEASCQETVPQSLIAFLESKDFEDAIRLTVALGGDADTMGAITGPVAAAYYKEIPPEMREETLRRLPEDMLAVLKRFDDRVEGARGCSERR
ncbi:MAG: ADP-ribosylglycohydrolase family protein [Bacteroidales bacterium]|nr:ADP-ribosylglycohydrolase family protein [Bacteroidales bacterium]